MRLRPFITGVILASAASYANAANPILPLWEHIPDGEPYLFDDPDQPGKKRVYLYGSHDMLRTSYCGTDLVVWSASPDSLDTWRYDGVIFRSVKDADGNNLRPDGTPDVLFAPDVAVKTLPDGKKLYYLYPNNQAGERNGQVAVSDRPDGPFKVINWDPEDPKKNVGVLRFDPAVFVDDDGRVYGYWGFERSYAAELDPDNMATVKEGTEIVTDLMPGRYDQGEGHFFEASSIRKIDGKYVFIYSRMAPDGEWGLHGTNYTLAYAYSDNPLGPFTYGGTIIDGRGRDTDADGKPIVTATPNGNTHGSILKIGDQWWVFYHRQGGTDEYARQAMVAPIEVTVEPGPGGEVHISEGEYTSEGFETGGLDPLRRYPAAIASHYTGPTPAYQKYPRVFYSGPYFRSVYHDDHAVADPYNESINMSPVVNNTDGSILGYKYYNFDRLKGCKGVDLVLDIIPESIGGTITVYTEAPWKGSPTPVGHIDIKPAMPDTPIQVRGNVSGVTALSGKHPLYLVFSSPEKDKSICTVNHLQFQAHK
ncbi:MAG: family 43 glycosylhydrolase [Duncaniella sp.]|nr:family 43 glycosylhydrolase [Duncaniella sp.]